MPDTFETNLGPMTAAQIGDELTYRSYRAQRHLYNLSAERLAGFFGEEPVRVMEERYIAEVRAAAKKRNDDFHAAQDYFEQWCREHGYGASK